jgi:hypothetical protein
MISKCETTNEYSVPAQKRFALGDLLPKFFESDSTTRLVISTALVIPCFWQPIVSGVDLQSHL